MIEYSISRQGMSALGQKRSFLIAIPGHNPSDARWGKFGPASASIRPFSQNTAIQTRAFS